MLLRPFVALSVSVMATAPALAQPYADGHMGWGDGWGHMFGGGIFMLLFWVAVVGMIVWLVMAALRRVTSGTSRSALDILEERYARGEIDRADYETRRQDLMRDRP